MTMPSYDGTSNSTPAAPPPEPAADDGSGLVEIFLTVSVRCSDGAHHGVHRVPRAEAASLLARRIAVAGTEPPPSWSLEVPPS
jgi:hypothetical protein